jgi:folate-binding protein YgfZ
MQLGFYDRTSRGRLIVTGRDRKDLLHRLATNSIEGLEPGGGTSCCFCTPKGRMIDWCVVIDRGEDLLVLTANPERLSGHIQQYTITEDVTVRNYMAVEIVMCGSRAKSVLDVDVEPWNFTEVAIAGVKVQAVRIEPLAGDAYSVLAPDAVALRRLLAEEGESLGAPDVERLRIRWGIPAFPNEINENHNPWEAGLTDAISLHKGCYIGQEVIARLNTYEKVKRRLVSVRLERTGLRGEPLFAKGEEVGNLTTVSGDIALAYVSADVEGELDNAEIIETPF